MRSSVARSRAGSAAPAGSAALLEAFARGEFPSTLYVEGPSEPLKAAFLAELRATWGRGLAEERGPGPRAAGRAPSGARILRAAESSVEEMLSSYHGGSLFDPRTLTIVLDVEDLGRSEKKVTALAAGLGRPGGGSMLTLVESAADAPRKSLEPLRAASAQRWIALPPDRRELLAWGRHRLGSAGLEAEPGVLEAVADASEGDPLVFFSELGKLETLARPGAAGGRGRVGAAEAALLLRPVVGADLPDYLAAVALGEPGQAARTLGRLLAAGVSEGAILFALANLVGGSLGGWARFRDLSESLRRRLPPRALAAALDAVYRAEAAWKGGRADAVAVLEQATRAVAGAA